MDPEGIRAAESKDEGQTSAGETAGGSKSESGTARETIPAEATEAILSGRAGRPELGLQDAASMARVREILLGRTLREVDLKLGDMHIALDSLRTEFERKLTEVRSSYENGLQSLSKRTDTALKELSRRLGDRHDEAVGKMRGEREGVVRAMADLRRDLTGRIETLSDREGTSILELQKELADLKDRQDEDQRRMLEVVDELGEEMERDLREALTRSGGEVQALRSSLDDTRLEIDRLTRKELAGLQSSKLGRERLAELLVELGTALRRDEQDDR